MSTEENGYADAVNLVLASSSSSSSSSSDVVSINGNETEVLDYNEAFPQLNVNGHHQQENTFFSSASFNGRQDNVYPLKKAEDERRRQIAVHERLATTKIIEIPPEERLQEKNSSNVKDPSARTSQRLQKFCTKLQKETSTNITFLSKDQTLIVTITGRPEQVRSAQVQILAEVQQPIKRSVEIPSAFHKFIIGPRAVTLRQLEQETMTKIAIPSQESQSNGIVISGAKDNVKLAEQRIVKIYQTQFNKGYERLPIPSLYHPWIRHQCLEMFQRKFNVTLSLPPPSKPVDELSLRGERQPVEQARNILMQVYQNYEGKIFTFPLEIPCEQHRFVLGKKGAGLKEIFSKTNVFVRIPNQEEKCSTIQVIGEMTNIGDAITMIYKMANALTAVHIKSPHWMHSVVKGERSSNLDLIRKTYPDVRIYFRDDHIDIEGPPEQVEPVRSQIQTVIDDLNNSNTTFTEIDIDPQFYKQLIGKNQIHLTEIQDQTGCDIKFPIKIGQNRNVKLMGTKESVEKAKGILLERVQKLSNERTMKISIDPQFYPQIIGAKGKKLDELRAKFHNIQIRFPQANEKSDEVELQGDKDDVDKCFKYLQQKIKDFYSIEFELSKRFYPLLIGKSGANIQRIRENCPDVRLDVPILDETKENFSIRLTGKKFDVDKTKKFLDEHVAELQRSIENSTEISVQIDPKWHGRFFLNNRKLLIEIQKEFGEVSLRIPEKKSQSDQIVLRGEKSSVEKVEHFLKDLIDKWENTTTKQIEIPHRHHGYLLAQGGAFIQPIQKQFNVQIKFPLKDKENHSDVVKISGRIDDVEQAAMALEKMIPIETTVEIPFEIHGNLVGKNGNQLQKLIETYPDVQITFPPVKSQSNSIRLKGQAEQVELFRKDLIERYEKFEAEKKARSFEIRLNVKPEFRSLILGNRRRPAATLKQKFDVNIQEVSSTNDEEEKEEKEEIEIVIRGYEDRVNACRDEILKLIELEQSKITMEIEIDHRIHARIIGTGGQKLQQLAKEYEVEIKFPTNQKSDHIYVTGVKQEKIDDCIEHLLTLEEDFIQDLPSKPTATRRTNKQSQHQQAPFKVKNAPWKAENPHEETNGNYNDEYPSMKNGAAVTTNDETRSTNYAIPVVWGPTKRKH